MKFFSPYFEVTPQMGLLKNSQNETFGFTLKNFAWGFYFLTSIYILEFKKTEWEKA